MRFNFLSTIFLVLVLVGSLKSFTIIDKFLSNDKSKKNIKTLLTSSSKLPLINTNVAYAAQNQDVEPQESQAQQTEADSSEQNTTTEAKIDNSSFSNNLLASFEMTSQQISLLKELAKRREQLDQRESKLNLKENMLTSTEERIEEKLSNLKDLQNKIDDLLKDLNKKQDEKILRLVKIYENMKPKDAARIFNQLDDDLIIELIKSMRENRVALILANMNPIKAKEVSSMYSEKYDVNLADN